MRPHLILLAATISCAPLPVARERIWTKFETLCKIQDKRIDESSGICAGRFSDDVFYTHNDSGDTARFFAFDRSGRFLATYNLTNAKPAVDWEDIASANGFIYCGDIGDNNSKRSQIYVYRVPEPHPPTSPRHATVKPDELSSREGVVEWDEVRADRLYTLTYPDGPHDAETLMVQPRSGDLYIVTKTASGGSGVYVLRHPGASGTYRLQKIGEVQVGVGFAKLITGGDISPDSKHVVLRTYFVAWEFDAPAIFDDWIKQKPRLIETNADPQGEGICYSRDGEEMLTTSEGSPCLVSVSRLKR